MATQSTDNELPEVPDIAMDAEDSREAQSRGARTHDLDVCVSRGPDDDHVEAAGTTKNLTKEPNQLDTSSVLLPESVVDETMPRGHVCSQKTDTVYDKTGDEVKNNRNESMLVAAKMTRNVMDDAHGGTMTLLETLRVGVNLVTADDGKHRVCDTVFYDTTTTIVLASTDEAVETLHQGGTPEKGECPSWQKALDGTWMTLKRRQRHDEERSGRSETCGWQGRDARAERSDDTAHAGRFSLVRDSTDSNGSDLTMKRHVEERRNVLVTLGRLRNTRESGNAVSTAREGQSAAVVTATWSKPRVGTSLADPGGFELEELGGGRWAQRNGKQHASVTLDGRRSGDTPIWKLMISELRFGWRRRRYNNGWTGDLSDTSTIQRALVPSRV